MGKVADNDENGELQKRGLGQVNRTVSCEHFGFWQETVTSMKDQLKGVER
jgi:hypothetical protein